MPTAAAAAVATGFLKDLIAAGHLHKDMQYLAMDRGKLRRARHQVMKGAQVKDEERQTKGELQGICFDGRKDETRVLQADEIGRLHPRIVKEEHISVTWEPEGRYLGHFTPDPAIHPEKPAKMVAKGVYFMMERAGALELVDTLGGDSYNDNTGW